MLILRKLIGGKVLKATMRASSIEYNRAKTENVKGIELAVLAVATGAAAATDLHTHYYSTSTVLILD